MREITIRIHDDQAEVFDQIVVEARKQLGDKVTAEMVAGTIFERAVRREYSDGTILRRAGRGINM